VDERINWNWQKVNVKLSLFLIKHHTMRCMGECDPTAPNILNLGSRWSGKLLAPAAIPPEKESSVFVGE
jgi:hypothetical protein